MLILSFLQHIQDLFFIFASFLGKIDLISKIMDLNGDSLYVFLTCFFNIFNFFNQLFLMFFYFYSSHICNNNQMTF